MTVARYPSLSYDVPVTCGQRSARRGLTWEHSGTNSAQNASAAVSRSMTFPTSPKSTRACSRPSRMNTSTCFPGECSTRASSAPMPSIWDLMMKSRSANIWLPCARPRSTRKPPRGSLRFRRTFAPSRIELAGCASRNLAPNKLELSRFAKSSFARRSPAPSSSPPKQFASNPSLTRPRSKSVRPEPLRTRSSARLSRNPRTRSRTPSRPQRVSPFPRSPLCRSRSIRPPTWSSEPSRPARTQFRGRFPPSSSG